MHTGLDLDYRVAQGWDEVKKEVFYWDPKDDEGLTLRQKALEYDVNDFILRNGYNGKFYIDEHLPSIKIPSLILHVQNDLWLRVGLAQESAKRIPGARFASFSDPMAHYAVFRAPHALKEEVLSFFKEIGLK
jgi:homoserine O-acetyltransferase/O-succinyltransferase